MAIGRRWLGGWLALWASCAAVAGGTPEQKMLALRQALVGNDLPRLLRQAVAPAELARMREEQQRERAAELSEDALAYRRKEFQDSFGQLLPADAVTRLLEQARPRMAEARGMFLMGSGAFFYEVSNSLRTDASLEADDRNQLLALLNAAQLYLARVDVFDERRMERALTALSRAARATGISSYDELHRLDFDALLGRFSAFLPAGKQMFAAYDLDVDGTLRSARFRTVAQDLDRATVRVSLTVLDVPVEFPMQLTAIDGEWYLVAPPTHDEPAVEQTAEVAEEAVAAAVVPEVAEQPAGESAPASKVEVKIHRPVRVLAAEQPAPDPTDGGCPLAESCVQAE